MFNKIQELIDGNNLLLTEAYIKISEKMNRNENNSELKEIAALLKINEIILMELKDKQFFNNEKNILKSLQNMKKSIISAIIELDNRY